MPHEEALHRAAVAAAHTAAGGPLASSFDVNPLLPRSRSVMPDFAAWGTGEDGKTWRCVRMRVSGSAAGGDGASSEEVERAGSRHVSVPMRLTEAQVHTLELLAVSERLTSVAQHGTEALHGTIYEVIIHPAMNAFAYISPRLLYLLAREILAILIIWVRSEPP